MDLKENRMHSLREKFWNGETSLEDERLLKEYYRHLPEEYAALPEEQYFILLASDPDAILDENFDVEVMSKIRDENKPRSMAPWLTGLAAILLLVLTIGLVRFFAPAKPDAPSIAVQPASALKDPELARAYEQTREALMFVSSKLNKGQEQTLLLGKFDKAKQQVQYTIVQ